VTTIDEHALDDLARGAAILGTGGGGHPYIGMLLAKQAIREHGPVELVQVDELDDDALVVPTAMMGAPTIFLEKIPNGAEFVNAFEALARYRGHVATHTCPAEAGGVNALTPFVVAARKRVPVVDADFMGRAFPELQMCTPTMYGISATPMAMADDKGNSVILETPSNAWTERIARTITIEMGCASMIALYSLSGAQLKKCGVRGTVSLSSRLGRLVREERAAHRDPVGAVVDALSGHRLFEGKAVDVDRRTESGFARAAVAIDGTGPYADSRLLLDARNEWLSAERDGEIVATAPDLIICLDSETGEAVLTEEIRYGFRVVVLAAPCDARWRTDAGLELAGPRCFGLDLDYVPIEARAQQTAEARMR